MNGRVTLARVAAAAGVSSSTVSKVLNGRTGVSADRREQVERVIAELGYVGVSERGRPVRGAHEPLVELVVDSLLNPWTLEVLAGALAAADSARTAIVARYVSGLEPESALKWAERLARSGRIAVVEVTSRFSRQREAALRSVGLPWVLVDPIDVPRTSIYSVGATNRVGGRDAARHLIDLGHERIGYIGGPVTAACDMARKHGYRTALQEARLKVADRHVVNGTFTFEYGLAAALEMLAEPRRPTALFVASDIEAMGVLEAARRLDIAVPRDLSVVGFDNTVLAANSAPPLTTVHQPVFDIGRTAVSMALRVAAGELPPSKRIELATHLVHRDSTAPPAGR